MGVYIKLLHTKSTVFYKSCYIQSLCTLMMANNSSLAGKAVLVTGASSGIGAGVANHFATLGCRLCLVGRNATGLEAVTSACKGAASPLVVTIVADIAKEEAPAQIVKEAVEKLGGLDVLVNSAGILMSGSVETLAVADYDKVMNINTRAAFLLTQAVIPALLVSKGNIVHISSVTGLRAFPGVVSYNMSKAALDMLTRTQACPRRIMQGSLSTARPPMPWVGQELCKRLRTQWASRQAQQLPSSQAKLLPLTAAGALCVQDRTWLCSPFMQRRKR